MAQPRPNNRQCVRSRREISSMTGLQQIKFSNLERPTAPNFDLDQTSRPPTRYRDWRIRGTHDPKGLGLACRVVSVFAGACLPWDEQEGEMIAWAKRLSLLLVLLALPMAVQAQSPAPASAQGDQLLKP